MRLKHGIKDIEFYYKNLLIICWMNHLKGQHAIVDLTAFKMRLSRRKKYS